MSAPSAMMRSLPMGWHASSGKQSSPPAMPINSDTQAMALMCGSYHSSKYTRGRRLSVAAAWAMSVKRCCIALMRCIPCSACPTMAASWYSIEKISATLRWLKMVTCTPARISCAAMSACKSEKPITQSGLSATILSILALKKALTRGLSNRACGGRTV